MRFPTYFVYPYFMGFLTTEHGSAGIVCETSSSAKYMLQLNFLVTAYLPLTHRFPKSHAESCPMTPNPTEYRLDPYFNGIVRRTSHWAKVISEFTCADPWLFLRHQKYKFKNDNS